MSRTVWAMGEKTCGAMEHPGRVVVGLLMMMAVALLGLGSRPAAALPKYAAREGRSCVVCHTNPGGAGPLTEAGGYYRQNDYSLIGYRPRTGEKAKAPASRAEIEARLEILEQELAALKEALAAVPPEEAEEVAVLPAAPRGPAVSGLSGRVSVGGYSEFTFSDREDGDSNFDVLRLVPKFSAQIAPKLFFNSEIEFEHLGDVAKGGEVVVEEARLDFLVRPELNFRAGGLLVPFNQLNILHDGPLRELTDRPLVDRIIVPTTWTEPGAGVYGSVRLGPRLSMNYETYLVNGLGPGISEAKGLREARRGGLKDNNRNKALVGRLGVVPGRGLELGVSGYEGKWDDDNQLSLSMLGLDLAYRRGPLKVLGEWARVRVERDAAAIAEGVPAELAGYYLEASYRLGRWAPVVHFSRMDPDRNQVSRYDVSRLVLGLNYRPSEQALVKVEWQRNRERVDEIANDAAVASVTHYF